VAKTSFLRDEMMEMKSYMTCLWVEQKCETTSMDVNELETQNIYIVVLLLTIRHFYIIVWVALAVVFVSDVLGYKINHTVSSINNILKKIGIRRSMRYFDKWKVMDRYESSSLLQ